MRIVRVFGKFLISLGVGVLLFVLWILYGTGIYTDRQQRALEDAWERLPTLAAAAPGDDTAGPPAGFKPGPGDPVFRLVIPEIDVRKMVVEGVGTEELRKGPGHYPQCRDGFSRPYCTPFDEIWPGEEGRVIVSGHRTTYGAPFSNLDKLREGDRITAETKWGDFHYRVTHKEIVPPDSRGIVVQEEGVSTIVLTTCNPKFSAAERLIVFAELEETA